MRDEKSRTHLGVASAEHEFTFFPDVINVVGWIERLSAVQTEPQPRPTLRKAISGAADKVGEAREIQTDALDRDIP